MEVVSSVAERGYEIIEREWHSGDRLTLTLTMPVSEL